jgi:acyl-phosphate glycerol 3-phosphate acyltransferase
MPHAAQLLLTVLAAYLVGGIPFGYLVARCRGVDIFRAGSGNIGATNVGRVLGARLGVLVFVADFAKGALPVFAARQLGFPATEQVLVGLVAILGHMFPIYLRFRGGKGVATGAGVVTVLVPQAMVVALLVWVALAFAWHYVSLSSIGAAIALALAHIGFAADPWTGDEGALTAFCFAAVLLVIVRHRGNLARLLAGSENRIPESRSVLLASKVVHVLALGLWFGAGVFFTAGAVQIFQAFEHLADTSEPGLPWRADITRERATALAGVAVNPLFAIYFPMQVACGILALGTALGWKEVEDRRLHHVRIGLLAIALAIAVAAWPLARHVGKLRLERYDPNRAIASAAQVAFASWHFASVSMTMATLFLSGTALGLAAHLPDACVRTVHDKDDRVGE